ncbi:MULTISPECIES: hypothetical protein [unclassified Pseudomonas]|nr:MULTISPECIES: hypothetical protein [unclassified Pseudomonas]
MPANQKLLDEVRLSGNMGRSLALLFFTQNNQQAINISIVDK